MVTHSNILAWKNSMVRGMVGYSPWDREELDMTERAHAHTHTHTHTHTHYIAEKPQNESNLKLIQNGQEPQVFYILFCSKIWSKAGSVKQNL